MLSDVPSALNVPMGVGPLELVKVNVPKSMYTREYPTPALSEKGRDRRSRKLYPMSTAVVPYVRPLILNCGSQSVLGAYVLAPKMLLSVNMPSCPGFEIVARASCVGCVADVPPMPFPSGAELIRRNGTADSP